MHLYLHIPFCARRCSYCDFAIAVRRRVPSAEYADAVLAEWNQRQNDPAWDGAETIETIYLGGGTPSHLAPGQIARILDTIGRSRTIAGDAEITLEANPDDITTAAARCWRSAGVNRISLGVQSFDPAVLRWMHRTHSVEQVPAAVATLRDTGLDELSLDLIFGLPAELGRDWAADLQRAMELDPAHLSLYGLTVEPATPMGHWVERGDVTPIGEETYATEFLLAHRSLGSAGYHHYEVSNYARTGHRARHNSAYWQRASYLGLGPGAHSGAGKVRRWNVRDWSAYRRLIAAGDSVEAGAEELDADAVRLEELYLGLRTVEGVPAGMLNATERTRWQEQGWSFEEGGRVRLTAEGWLRLDALVASASRSVRGL
jgi:oxygen-independent coproporphyrinogen-3 oxidase